MAKPVEFVDAENLAELIKDPTKEPGKDYLVVDVRDDDYVCGHIPGAINIPSHTLADEVNKLIDNYGQVPEIFFHCALSQQRGPSSARVYSETLLQKDTKTSQKIQILRGGFVQWQEKYKDDPQLVEDYDKDAWEQMEYY
ncbi:11664_t:CDS:2 [Paraglomus brasilianum]|uniref:11664_t:CDS:1 n=1 Tax=Paraglomus brasilianum TaxID=144538 RepID=A0A9N9BSP8_9GLOM|nr:11664_t:CDS:2 [Paraglomus brasilianum]